MAKLICDDGTEVEISKETEANLREKFGKKEFKKIKLCHLRIDVKGRYVRLSWAETDESKEWCDETPLTIRNTIKCLQSAIDYIEDK